MVNNVFVPLSRVSRTSVKQIDCIFNIIMNRRVKYCSMDLRGFQDTKTYPLRLLKNENFVQLSRLYSYVLTLVAYVVS